MSADNWAICPKCKKVAYDAAEKLKEKANKSYGKVEPEKYLELMKKAKEPVKLEQTLREDYHIGIDEDGSFNISYSANCMKCDLQFSHNDSKRVPL